MKHIFILLFLIAATTDSSPQESWIRIYNQQGWNIDAFHKIGAQNSLRQILIKHEWIYGTASIENGNVKSYNRISNSWYRPVGGLLSTECAHCVDPPVSWTECRGSDFFMISPQDSNFAIGFRLTLCAMCPDASTFLTWNGGLNWTNYYSVFGSLGTPPNGGDFDQANDSVLYYGFSNGESGNQPAIFKSTNRGVNWQMMQVIPNLRYAVQYSGFYEESSNGFVLVSPFSSDVVFTNHRDNLLRSTNAGNSFTPTVLPALKELSFDRFRNRTLGIESSVIHLSNDNGTNWISISTPVMFNTLEPVESSSDVIFAGSDIGLYRSTNGGQSWHLYNNTFSPSKKVIGICKDPDSGDTLIVCTTDAVYKVFRDELTNYESSAQINPGGFELHQNFPNPFNPQTRITFTIPARSHVTLNVYDAEGKLVSNLIDEERPTGNYTALFSAHNNASGIYYYKLTAGDYTETRKMLLLK